MEFCNFTIMPITVSNMRTLLCPILLVIILTCPRIIKSQTTVPKTIIELDIDNDINFLIDRYYSSGVVLGLYINGLKKSPVNYLLFPSTENEKNYYSMSIRHNMYTPEKTLTPDIVANDHPYATYFLIGGMKTTFNSEKLLKRTSMLEIGFIGPLAGGEQIQNILHDNISYAQHSKGWHNQIQNDFCLQYSASLEKGIINLPVWEIIGFFSVSVGIPHTEAQFGGYTRLGLFNDYFEGISIDISPDLSFWVEMSGSIFLVNYNATLQGGAFNQNNVHVIDPINSTLIQGTIGGAIEYKRVSAKYGMVVRSPEFSTAFWHRWAHLAISFAF